VSDPLLGEIGRQGAAIRGAAAALGHQADAIRAIARDRPDGRIVLTGMGSSLAAGHALVATLGRAGIPVDLVNAAELLHFGLPTLDARTTLVVVSQSGRSVEVVRILDALPGGAGGRPFVVGITNGPANPLSDAADVALDIAVGDELGPATMTFAATLVALDALGRLLLTRDGAAAVVDEVTRAAGDAALAIDRLTQDRPALIDAVTGWADGRRTLVIVGRGVGRAASDMASLTLKEVAGVAAESMITADFRHGPLELVGPDLAIAFICVERETDAIDRAFAAELGRGPTSVLVVVEESADAPAGVRSIVIGPVAGSLAPAVAVVPFQLLARELAIAAGRRPGAFRHASKVTTTE